MRRITISFHHVSVFLAMLSMLYGVAFAADRKSGERKPASAPTAVSGNKGVSVVATDSARVTINQTINQINQTDPDMAKALLKEIEDRRREQAKREQAEQEASKLRIERDSLAAELELARTYQRIAQEAHEPDADETVKQAREALLKGDWQAAMNLVFVQEQRIATAAEKSLRKAAGLARERAALAEGRDTATAVTALKKATEYEPDNPENWWRYGDMLMTWGKLAEARAAYERYHGLVAEKSVRDPANTKWQRDLSISYDRIGNMQKAQGDLAGALKSYRDSLDIAKQLSARDPANVQWACDVAVSLSKLASLAPKGLATDKAIAYLQEGRETLMKLNQQGRLTAVQQSWLSWFDKRLAELENAGGKE